MGSNCFCPGGGGPDGERAFRVPRVHADTHTHTPPTRTQVHTYIHTNVHTYTRTHVHTDMRTHGHMKLVNGVKLYTRTRTHAHTYTHTHVHTDTRSLEVVYVPLGRVRVSHSFTSSPRLCLVCSQTCTVGPPINANFEASMHTRSVVSL